MCVIRSFNQFGVLSCCGPSPFVFFSFVTENELLARRYMLKFKLLLFSCREN